MGKIGLVTVLFKSDDVLDDFFASIARQTYKDHILYLVDNSPNDVSDTIKNILVKVHQVNPSTKQISQQSLEIILNSINQNRKMVNNEKNSKSCLIPEYNI